MTNNAKQPYEFGRFRLERSGNERKLYEDGRLRSQQPSALQLQILEKFLKQPGDILSAKTLKEGTGHDKSSVGGVIHALRQIGFEIETIRGLRRSKGTPEEMADDLTGGYRLKAVGMPAEGLTTPDEDAPKIKLPDNEEVNDEGIQQSRDIPNSDDDSSFVNKQVQDSEADQFKTERPKTGKTDSRPSSEPQPASVPSAPERVKSDVTTRDFVFISGIVCSGILLLPIILLWDQIKLSWPQWDPRFNHALFGFQAIGVIIGIAYDWYQKQHALERPPEDADTETAIKQFRTSWTWLLVTWGCLYVAWWILPEGWAAAPGRVITTALNNGNSLTLTLCYLVLDRRTVASKLDQSATFPFKPGLALLAGFSIAEIVLIEICKSYLHVTSEYVLMPADIISGFVGAVALALCVSRLHSRLLGPSMPLPFIPYCLYLYAVIQPFYVLINDAFSLESFKALADYINNLKPVIVHLAFLLKALMFIYVMELIRSRRLLFYMLNAEDIHAYVEGKWGDFRVRRKS